MVLAGGRVAERVRAVWPALMPENVIPNDADGSVELGRPGLPAAADDGEREVVDRRLGVEAAGRGEAVVDDERVGRPAAVRRVLAVRQRRVRVVLGDEQPVRGERLVRLVVGAVAGGQDERLAGPVVGRDRAGADVGAAAHDEVDLAGRLEDGAALRPRCAGHAAAASASARPGGRHEAVTSLDEVAGDRRLQPGRRPERQDPIPFRVAASGCAGRTRDRGHDHEREGGDQCERRAATHDDLRRAWRGETLTPEYDRTARRPVKGSRSTRCRTAPSDDRARSNGPRRDGPSGGCTGLPGAAYSPSTTFRTQGPTTTHAAPAAHRPAHRAPPSGRSPAVPAPCRGTPRPAQLSSSAVRPVHRRLRRRVRGVRERGGTSLARSDQRRPAGVPQGLDGSRPRLARVHSSARSSRPPCLRRSSRPRPRPRRGRPSASPPACASGHVRAGLLAGPRSCSTSGLVNCTRTGGWVQTDGSCKGYGSGRYSAYVAPDPLLGRHSATSSSRPYARLLATKNVCTHFYGGTPLDRMRAAGYTSDHELGREHRLPDGVERQDRGPRVAPVLPVREVDERRPLAEHEEPGLPLGRHRRLEVRQPGPARRRLQRLRSRRRQAAQHGQTRPGRATRDRACRSPRRRCTHRAWARLRAPHGDASVAAGQAISTTGLAETYQRPRSLPHPATRFRSRVTRPGLVTPIARTIGASGRDIRAMGSLPRLS